LEADLDAAKHEELSSEDESAGPRIQLPREMWVELESAAKSGWCRGMFGRLDELLLIQCSAPDIVLSGTESNFGQAARKVWRRRKRRS